MENRTPKKLTKDDKDSSSNNLPVKRRKQNEQDTDTTLYGEKNPVPNETPESTKRFRKRQTNVDLSSPASTTTVFSKKTTSSEPSQKEKGQKVVVKHAASNAPNSNNTADIMQNATTADAKLTNEKQESNIRIEITTRKRTSPKYEESHDNTNKKNVKMSKGGTLLPHNFKPSPYSVIIGRGKESKDHAVGNQRLRVLVSQHLSQYKNAINRTTMSNIVSSVVSMVREACTTTSTTTPKQQGQDEEDRSEGHDEAEQQQIVGAFVKLGKDGRWYEVTDAVAREKVGYTFRDMLGERYRSSSRYKVAQKRRLRREGSKQDTGKEEEDQGGEDPKKKEQIYNIKNHDGNQYHSTGIFTSSRHQQEIDRELQKQQEEEIISEDIIDYGHHDHQQYPLQEHTSPEVPPAAYDDDFASEDESSTNGSIIIQLNSSSSKTVTPSAVAGKNRTVQQQGLLLPKHRKDDILTSGFSQEGEFNHIHITNNALLSQGGEEEETFVDPFSSGSTSSSSSSAITATTSTRTATNTTTSTINPEALLPTDQILSGREDHATTTAVASTLAGENLEINNNVDRASQPRRNSKSKDNEHSREE